MFGRKSRKIKELQEKIDSLAYLDLEKRYNERTFAELQSQIQRWSNLHQEVSFKYELLNQLLKQLHVNVNLTEKKRAN